MRIQRHKNKKLLINKKQWKHTGKFPNKGYIPKIRQRPFFKFGDLVGFRTKLQHCEGIIQSHLYDKHSEIKYIVKILEKRWYGDKNNNTEVFEWELYMKPLTREVLIEKKGHILKSLKLDKFISGNFIVSGTTTVSGAITDWTNKIQRMKCDWRSIFR